MKQPPIVAIAADFLEAYGRIPRAQQKKVRTFTEKFRADPMSSAINYEKIHHTKDPKVRTVRIGIDYRAVILRAEKSNVFMLVWVAHHDEAMDWARNKRFEINPATGAFQIFNTEKAREIGEKEQEKEGRPLFRKLKDKTLLKLGVPAEMLTPVREIKSTEGLLAMSAHIPQEAFEALQFIDEGLPLDEVMDLYVPDTSEVEIDTEDFGLALEHPDSQRRIKAVTGPEDLAAMMKAPLEKWRVFLHPTQRELVRKKNKGPVRVLGGAGTGKTVVAMHRAVHLVRETFRGEHDRVLFTTFTSNLARNVEQNLRELCSPDELRRLEVVHLHKWAVSFLRSRGKEISLVSGSETSEYWEEAIALADETDFDLGFLRQEWEEVVQAKSMFDKTAYVKVSRKGRGRPLTRAQRLKVWKVFDEYRQTLETKGKIEWVDAIRQAREVLEDEGGILPYRAIVVDEGQDFHEQEWLLIRAMVPPGENDLFIVGDAHQRIYGRPVVLGRCGINIKGRRSKKLRVNYRTTEEIRDWAVALLRGISVDDLDGGLDSVKGYKSLRNGAEPGIYCLDTLEEEQRHIIGIIREYLDVETHLPSDICLVARRTRALTHNYQKALARAKIPCVVLEREDVTDHDRVRLATMHRVKGLEFPFVIIAGVNAGDIPLERTELRQDPLLWAEHLIRERCLFFVASTRARDRLVITSSGEKSEFLD